jgi:hypothetical protein
MTDKLEQENQELKQQLAAIKQERDTYRGQIRIGEEQKKFHAAAVAVGCNPNDTEDLFAIFKHKGLITYDAESDRVISYQVPGVNPVTYKAQIETHKIMHPTFFKPREEGIPSKEYNQNSLTDRTQQYLESQQKTPIGFKAPTKNPFSKEYENLTEQTRIYRDNPLLAEKLKLEAG